MLFFIKFFFNLIEMKYFVNVSCFFKGKMKLKECSFVYKIFIGDVFSYKFLDFFVLFLVVFKCYVINIIVLVYNR